MLEQPLVVYSWFGGHSLMFENDGHGFESRNNLFFKDVFFLSSSFHPRIFFIFFFSFDLLFSSFDSFSVVFIIVLCARNLFHFSYSLFVFFDFSFLFSSCCFLIYNTFT